jgi:hypothetical protein
MNGVEILSPERIAEIKAFKNTDFSDCPIMTEEEAQALDDFVTNNEITLGLNGSG